jgi:hypothetical protein
VPSNIGSRRVHAGAATHSKTVTHDLVSRRLMAEIARRVRPVNSRRVKRRRERPRRAFFACRQRLFGCILASDFGVPTCIWFDPVTRPLILEFYIPECELPWRMIE